jgi:release factor family 7
MDRIRSTDLRDLLDARQGPCVSLFMPLTPAGRDSRGDEIQLRNLTDEAADTLIQRGMRQADAKALLAPLKALPQDEETWRHRNHALAVFLAPGFLRVFNTKGDLKASVYVDDQFRIRPLLRLAIEDERFYVLALSQNGVGMFEGDAAELHELTLRGLPRNLDDALKIEDADAGKQIHSATTGIPGKRGAVYHGQGGEPDHLKPELKFYCDTVARVVDRRLNGQRAPLVLAMVEPLVPIWRAASQYKYALDNFAAGNPDHLAPHELHAKTWPIVLPALARRRQIAWQRLQEAPGTKVSFGLERVVPAAIRAQIDSLFLDTTKTRWGRYKMEDESVEMHDQPQPGDQDLVELAAVETLKHKGEVFALQQSNGAAGEVAGALLRF